MNVSIVIPNYNGENYILDCIASIYDQIDNKRDIIIVDNHSTDRSIHMIQEHYPDITLIRNDENIGFAAAVNQGIRASKAEFIILLNNDAFARKGFVEALYRSISADPNIFSVAAKMLRHSEPGIIDNAGDELTIFGWAYKSGDGRPSEEFNKPRQIFSACAGAAIYRRQTFEEIGYFDERFFAYLEDVDIGFRANLHGYRNMFCPEAEVEHIGSATTGSKYNDFKVRISARNNVWLLKKNLSTGMFLLNVLFFLVGFLIKVLFFSFNGYGRSYLKGLWEARSGHKGYDYNRKKTRGFKVLIRIEKILISGTVSYVIKILRRLLRI